MKTKKIISLLLALAFCLTLLPAAAGAQQGDAGYDADDGFALLSDVGESPDDDPLAELAAATVDYYDPLAPEGQRMKSQGDCARITAKTTALADGWYAAGDVSVSARIKVTGDVNIILLDYSEFDALGGIYVAEGARLTIWGQSEGTGAGKLTVPDPGELKAGIGGNDYNDKEGNSGDITINGGILDVTGGYKTAGIGGGNHGSGNITINGGRVTAKGGTFGAGIGGGNCGSGSITVTGGYVEAQGGSEGAGIGAGDEKNGGTVEISGGTVKATGGTWAAGIGGGGVAGFNPGDVDVNGPGGSGGDVTISGGDVTAQGGEYGAGIGGGYRGSGLLSGKKIEISGGSVTAKGGQRAAGIGGGNHGNGGLDGSKVVISGGDVKAYGSEKWAAGIGGGNCGDGCEVEIKGGTVEVKAGDGSAQGIGCGDEGESSGDLSLFADARVTAGDAEPGSAVIANDRRKECRKKWVKIEPCTSHEIEGGSPVCKYCGGVPYFDPIFGTERVCTNFTELKNKKTLLLTSDWYVVSGDVKVDNVYVTGHADLILCDGAKLTVNNNIELTDSIYHDLTVWGQRKGDGALVVDNLNNGSSQDHWNAGIGGVVTSDGADLSKVFSNGGLLIVNGGSIISTGGKSGGAAIGGAYMGGGGRVRINGGSITAISNSKDAENIGAGAGGDYSGFIEFDANITHAGFRAGKSVSGAADDWLWYEVNYREMACHTKGDIVRIEPCTDHSFINGVCEYCNAKGSAKAPVITKQPGDLNLTSGYTEGNKLSVTAEADTGAAYKLSYQWYSCEDENKTNAAAIDGATNAEYVVPEGKDAGTVEYYFCTVTATRTDNDESVYTKSDTAKVTVSGESQGDSPTPGAVSYYVPIAPDGQHIKSENGCTKIKPDTAELGNGWYTAGDVTVSKRIRVTGKANIILLDESELLAPLGIYVAEDASLTVWAQSTGDDAGRLTIANVGSGLAGIGGNNYKDNEGNAGEITINGGVLNVKGGENGAGIGGGNHGACKSITINGGIIASCIGGKNGAGIGGGNCGAGGTININGGEIHAQGGSRGAGIGGGDWGEGGTVNISDGKIEARGGENAAGIGGGGPNDKEGRGGGEVTVSGGVVKAYGGTRGAGIGGGEYGNGGTLTVSGSCDVEARGGSYGAGIGGGDSGNGGEVTIDGGSVSAYGNNGSAGIGGGDYGNGGKLTVNDGFVYASGSTRDTSGAVTYQAAPGIGSGRPKDNGSAPLKSGVCEIYGGVVIAQAGETTVENKRAQAIGVNIADKDKNGNNGDDRLIIGEGMTVSAGAKDPGELVEAKNRISACREYGRAKIAPCEDHEIGDEGDKCKYCGSEIDEPIPGYISTICLTENGTAKNIAGAQQSIVYFGTYPQSSDGRGGYNTEPIKWRVLQNADGKLFILSDKNIEAFIYGKNGAEAKWSESELRKWLNGISSYSGGGFSAGAFTEKELSAIADTKLKNDDNTQVTVGSPDTTDSVFVLSITEAMNPSFGFDGDFKADGSRISINTDYASAGGAMKTEYGSTLRGPGEANYWWLRSPGSGISCAAHVTDTGYVDDSGIVLTANDVAVRPALNVDLSKVLFTSLAKGGKGGDEYSPDEWKLTLLDESRKDFAVSETAAESYPGGTVWLTFSGAAEGDNEYVSVIVCDKKGNPVYYGSVKTGVKEGRAGFTLPGDLPAGSYTMKAFSEQNNGDYMTDLASPFCSVALKVSKVYLWIGGEAVTSAHTSGEGWRFDAEKNTLYLDKYSYEGAGYEYTDEDGDTRSCGVYYNGKEVLTVSLTGENKITQVPNGEVDGSIGFYSTEYSADVTFTGGGSLTASSGKAKIGSDGIVIMGGMTVGNDTSVCAEGSADALFSIGVYAYNSLTVNGTLTASGGTQALLNPYTPAEGVAAWGSKAGEDDKEEYNKGDNDSYKWFRAEPETSCSLWVGGEEVTTAHASGEGWRFNPFTNTLYLENYTYEGAGNEFKLYDFTLGCGVCYVGEKALTVSLTGENKITQVPNGRVDSSTGFYSLESDTDVTFTGGGSLTASSGTAVMENSGININGGITVGKDTSVCAAASANDKRSYGVSTGEKTTVNGTLTASGGTRAFLNLYTPTEGVTAWGSKAGEDDKEEYNKDDNDSYKWFRAEYTGKSYNLWIGGEAVTSAHTSGEGWRFDADKNTLYLENYTYEGAGYEYTDTVGDSFGCGVYYNGEKALTVSLTGENTIKQIPNGEVDGSIGFYSTESGTDVTFTGGGSLTVSSGKAKIESDGIVIMGGITVGKDTSVCAEGSADAELSYGAVIPAYRLTVNGTLTASGATCALINTYTPAEGVEAWGSKAGEDDKEEYNKGDNDSYKWFRAEYTAESYNLWIGGEEVTTAHTSGEGWRFDADKNTLYLENYTYEGAGYEYTDTVGSTFGCGVCYNGKKALTVSLTGENTIKQIPNGEVDESVGFDSGVSGMDVTFTGGGSLTVSGGAARDASVGIDTIGNITIDKGTSVCAEGSADAKQSYGAATAYRLTVNGTLTASGATCALINTYTPAEGVEAWGSETDENGKVEYNKGDNWAYKWFRAEYTAESHNLWVGGEEVTTAHTSGENWRFDAEKNTLYLDKYSYEGAGYEYTDTVGRTFGCGVYYNGEKALTVSLTGENTITQVTDGEVDESVGFYSRVSGMDVTFTGGGSLTVSGGAARDTSVGITTIGNITIGKDTSVCAEGSADAKQSYGAATAYRLTVNGTLTASGGTRALITTYTPAEGVEAWGSETDENGKVEYNKGDNRAYKWFRAEYKAESYNLWIGGEEVTTAHTSGENWRFDAEKNTLYLDKYSYEGAGYEYTDTVGRTFGCGVYYNGEKALTVSLTGENTITQVTDGEVDESVGFYSRVSGMDVTFTGGGSLTVSGGAARDTSVGITTIGNITVGKDTSVCAEGSADAKQSFGAATPYRLTVNGTLTASGGTQALLNPYTPEEGVTAWGSETDENGKVEYNKGDNDSYKWFRATYTAPVTKYAVTVENGDGGGSYAAKAAVTITADAPASDKVFDKWVSSDGVTFADETSEKTTFTMPAKAVTVKATYKDKQYTVTVENGEGGGSYAAKAVVTITADAPASDKVFDKWISSDGVTFADETNAKTTFTMPAKAVTVKATYKDKPVTKYTVTVENGTGGGSYAAKATVTITADAPASDKVFDKWVSSDGVTFADATNAKTTFTMPAKAVTVKATYKDKPVTKYTVTVENGEGGGSYAAKDTVTITADAPASDKVFDKWVSSDGVTFADETNAKTTFTMPAKAVTVKATYKDKPVTKYTVTVENGEGGGDYAAKATVTITADAPAADKVFDKWTSSDGVTFADETSAKTTFTMPAKAVTVKATYKDKPVTKYTVTVENGEGGGDYAAKATVTITADTPASDKVFDKWVSSDGVTFADETNAKTTFTMPAKAVTVKATYKDKPVTKYTVTVENGEGGGSYAAKAAVTITADAPASDKVFDKWVSSDGVTFADETNAKTTFTMPAKAVTVKATYKDKPVTKYAVTVENGEGGGSYAAKAAVTITADAPASDKVFDKWVSSDGVTFADATNAKTTFTMPAKEVTVKATYKDKPVTKYTVTVENGEGGGSYAAKATVTITADAPASDKVFDKWISSDGVTFADETSAKTTFTMPAKAVTVKATYKDKPVTKYNVTVENGDGGGSYAVKATVTITADAPASDKVFDKWVSSDGVTFADETNAKTTFIMPAKAVTVKATYKDKPVTKYTVTVENGTGGGSYAAKDTVTITADAPAADKVFDKWISSDGVTFADATSAKTTFTMPAKAVTVKATYKDKPVTKYTVTVENGEGGGSYAAKATVTITADAPASDKVFDKWVSSDGVTFADETNAKTTFTMPAKAVTVKATYKDKPVTKYTVTVENGEGGGSYAAKAAVTITADAPASDKVFDKWISSDGVTFADATSAKTTFTMPAKAVTVKATYKDKPVTKYNVTVENGEGGGSYAAKAAVTITADAPASDKVFDKWTSSDGVTFADATNAKTTFTMPAKAVTVKATYKDKPVTKYNVTVENGTGTGSYAAKAAVTITADAPAADKVFDKWVSSDGVTFADATSAKTTFTMPAKAVTVKATYKDKQYTVTVENGEGGGSYAAKATVTITADAPASDKVFDKWISSDGVTFADETNAKTTFTMPAKAVIVKATYKDKPVTKYNVTVENGDGGGSYAVKATVTITADAPASDKVFDKWVSSDGVTFADETNAKTTFTMPAKAVTVKATYKDKPVTKYTVTVENGEGGGSYAAKATVTITADAPAADKVFDKWISSDGVTFADETNAKTTFEMPAKAVTVKATYKDKPVTKYTVTVENGEGGGSYAAKATVTITADAPAADKVFDKWVSSDGVTFADATNAKTTFTMPAKAVTVKATYKDKPVTKYTVTVENGTGGGSYAAKATVTITADAPASDKVFDKWISSDGVTFADETSAKTTFTMPAKAVTVKATYKDKPVTKYTVTVENGTGGGSYAAKAAVTITADAPASDKAFDKWVSSDGVTFADETSAKTTFEMPEKEVTVKATYKDKYNYSHGGSGGGGYSRYDVIIGNAEHGALTAAPKQPIRGDTVVLTAVPDAGYETVDVVVLDKNGKPVEVTKNADGTYSYQQPAGDVSVNVVFKPKNPFIDVSESSYYFAPVLWAVENGITNGTGDDTFGPEKTCTRAQLVTFLWRAEGCPEPTITESPFTDVPMNAYYYKAVLWAYENGVAKGVGEGRFDPDSTVTRGQSVTFLYRIAGSETDGEMPFVDVMEGEYWYDAILWAYKTGVTLGTSETTFGPNENCRRGDIVTFLYRVYNK